MCRFTTKVSFLVSVLSSSRRKVIRHYRFLAQVVWTTISEQTLLFYWHVFVWYSIVPVAFPYQIRLAVKILFFVAHLSDMNSIVNKYWCQHRQQQQQKQKEQIIDEKPTDSFCANSKSICSHHQNKSITGLPKSGIDIWTNDDSPHQFIIVLVSRTINYWTRKSFSKTII